MTIEKLNIIYSESIIYLQAALFIYFIPFRHTYNGTLYCDVYHRHAALHFILQVQALGDQAEGMQATAYLA